VGDRTFTARQTNPIMNSPGCTFMPFLGAFVGIAILFTRMENYRRTIDGAKKMRDHPGLVTDQTVITAARVLKKSVDRLK
jgi:hypothetical protein